MDVKHLFDMRNPAAARTVQQTQTESVKQKDKHYLMCGCCRNNAESVFSVPDAEAVGR